MDEYEQNLYSSDYPFETTYGYSRAVRVGEFVFVSGTTARTEHLTGDAYTQLSEALRNVAGALSKAGADLRHVVRTVVYVVDLGDAELVAQAHREAFSENPPASTLLQVAALTPALARVELEVTAMIHDLSRTPEHSQKNGDVKL